MKRFLFAFVLWAIATPGLAQEFQSGVESFQKGEYATAFRIFLTHAEQGDAAAQFNTGYMYRKGLGVSKNDVTALSWWRKSAEQGFEQAQQSLVFMYSNGIGTKVNHAEAAYWQSEIERARAPRVDTTEEETDDEAGDVASLQSAAEQGDADARVRLAKLYETGNSVPQDYVKAHAWYNLAAAQGREDAARKREQIAGKMTREDISEAQRLASELSQIQTSNN
jgi:TPR repeat protein